MAAMVAVVLAGGLSRRLGGVPKAGLLLEGRTLLARTLDGAAKAIARTTAQPAAQPTAQPIAQPSIQPAEAGGGAGTRTRIAVVGPVEKIREWLACAERGGDVVFVQEDPPFSGPAAGIAAGLAALAARPARPGLRADSEHVLVLACDMPQAGEVAMLLTAALAGCGAESGVMAVDNGRKQPLAGIYPLTALQGSVDAARQSDRLQNASVFSLLASVNIKECVVPVGLTADIDTWQDARAQGIGAGPAEAEGQQVENHDELLQKWTNKLLAAFEIADIDVDVHAVLNLAGVAAHSIVRPAAPLTTFVAGLAAGLAAGSGQADESVAMKAAIGMAKQLAAAETPAEAPAAAEGSAAEAPSGN